MTLVNVDVDPIEMEKMAFSTLSTILHPSDLLQKGLDGTGQDWNLFAGINPEVRCRPGCSSPPPAASELSVIDDATAIGP